MLGEPTNDIGSRNRGLVMVMDNNQLDQHNAATAAEEAQNQPLVSSLVSHVQNCWTANKTAKQPIEKILITAARQRNGDYEPEVLERLRQQGETDPIYMMITDIKCRAAIAWIKDVSIPPGEIPAHFEPTPIPEMPPEVIQAAKQRATKALQEHMMQMGMTAQQMAQDQDAVVEIMTQVRDEIKMELDEEAMEDAQQTMKWSRATGTRQWTALSMILSRFQPLLWKVLSSSAKKSWNGNRGRMGKVCRLWSRR